MKGDYNCRVKANRHDNLAFDDSFTFSLTMILTVPSVPISFVAEAGYTTME